MVKLAIAGGTGELGREVIDALAATGRHDIAILTRNATSRDNNDKTTTGIREVTVSYNDSASLAEALTEVHTVLSFINPSLEPPDNNSQKTLIDACVLAGVKRFAPSEYGSVGKGDLPFWARKKEVQDYLEEVNKDTPVLEYTLFQPGLFLDYLASPHRTARYVTPLDSFFDFNNRRAIVVEGYEDAYMCLTTVNDVAKIVAQAVDFEDEWPRIGGIQGNRVRISQVLEIGGRVRGRPFSIDKVKLEDLDAGLLETSWKLGKRHPGFTSEQADDGLEEMLKTVLIGTLKSAARGAWDVSDEWNRRLPNYQFTPIEGFLAEVWADEP